MYLGGELSSPIGQTTYDLYAFSRYMAYFLLLLLFGILEQECEEGHCYIWDWENSSDGYDATIYHHIHAKEEMYVNKQKQG